MKRIGHAVSRALAIAALVNLGTVGAAPASEPTLIIHAGHVLDVPGKPPRGASTITVQGTKIVSVADGYQPAASETARVIDLRDAFVLPGLIDAHVHLASDAGGNAAQLELVAKSPADFAYQAAENARKTLLAGFTTVRNLGDQLGTTRALRDAIEGGLAMGPRVVDAGASISVTAGHFDPRVGFRDELND